MAASWILAVACVVSAGEVRSFQRDVVPVLTKAGCNSGRCHGSFQGRGGFRLSLLGFDAAADYEAIVKERRGRRIGAAAPELSLLLRKAAAIVPHGGGKRFDVGSSSFGILKDYIAAGAPPPAAEDPPRIEVEPARTVLSPSQTQGLRVRATWADGDQRDVTEWALFDAAREGPIEISSEGVVTARQPGKVAAVVRFLGQVATVEFAIPYPQQDSAAALVQPPKQNYIDELVAADWQTMRVTPTRLATDAEFLRRVSLDLTGTLPAPSEAQSFLASTAADKRERLVDQLLSSSAYVEYSTLRWSDLLRAHRRYLGDRGLESFTGWLRQSVRDNRPIDEMAREILTGQGNLFSSGPAAFFFIDEQPAELAEATAQVFLGVRLQCARCHHHPFEIWSQEDYRGLAAFFTRLETKNLDPSGRFGGARILRVSDAVVPARRVQGDPQPKVLGGSPLVASPAESNLPADLRAPLASWITATDNPYFARNFVNRTWKQLLGRGLIEPVDDLRASNPASNSALLDALADDFKAHRFDIKYLIKTICQSSVYQLAADFESDCDADGSLWTHRLPRRLPAEVLLDAISHVTGTSEDFAGLPSGTRAISLPDPAVESRFLMTFGRPDRSNACDCARGSQTDLSQTLLLINSPQLQSKIASGKGRLAQLLKSGKSDQEIADEIYLAALSRFPSPEERAVVTELVTGAKSRQEVWEDILWSVLNTAEFTFNH